MHCTDRKNIARIQLITPCVHEKQTLAYNYYGGFDDKA
jgi:hypothetical protein